MKNEIEIYIKKKKNSTLQVSCYGSLLTRYL
jgi:hypothetical protein